MNLLCKISSLYNNYFNDEAQWAVFNSLNEGPVGIFPQHQEQLFHLAPGKLTLNTKTQPLVFFHGSGMAKVQHKEQITYLEIFAFPIIKEDNLVNFETSNEYTKKCLTIWQQLNYNQN